VTLDFGVLSFFILTSVDQNTVVPLYFFFILFFFFWRISRSCVINLINDNIHAR